MKSVTRIIIFFLIMTFIPLAAPFPAHAQLEEICDLISDFVPELPFGADFYRNQVDSYTDAIADDADTPDLYALRGDAFYALQEFESALEDYEQAIEIDPEYTYAYARLGDTYQQIFDPSAALDAYTHAITIDPEYAYAYVKRGIVYRKLGDAKELSADAPIYLLALEDMNRAIELDPTSALALGRRSELYVSLGNLRQAILDGQAAVAANPDDAFGHVVQANAYKVAGNYIVAMSLFETAIRAPTDLNSNYVYAFTARADLCRRVGNYEQARLDANRALEFDPTYGWAYFQLARIAMAEDNTEDAVDNLLLSVKYNPLYPFPYQLLEQLEADEEDYADSLAILQTWIDFQP